MRKKLIYPHRTWMKSCLIYLKLYQPRWGWYLGCARRNFIASAISPRRPRTRPRPLHNVVNSLPSTIIGVGFSNLCRGLVRPIPRSYQVMGHEGQNLRFLGQILFFSCEQPRDHNFLSRVAIFGTDVWNGILKNVSTFGNILTKFVNFMAENRKFLFKFSGFLPFLLLKAQK